VSRGPAPRPLRRGALLAPGYRVVEHISRGRPLDVYDVWSDARRTRCVAKRLRPDCAGDPRARRRLLAEGRLLRRLSHPHLVRAYEVIERPEPAVVLEPLPGDTLDRFLHEGRGRLPAPSVAGLGRQLAAAVAYLHGEGILHLDLKPSNVVVQAGRATLIDLSVARPPGRVRRGLGTPAYMSPEQARGGGVDAKADVWGLGCVLYEAATGLMPFDDDPCENGADPERAAAPVRARRRLPAALGAAIDRCLAPDPARRPAVTDLWRELGGRG
jgi:eukaryotic-like serine/threonine-protein kinase